MKKLKYVELVLENGESYTFDADKCEVVLNSIVDRLTALNGHVDESKVVNDVSIKIQSNEEWNEDLQSIYEQQNILELILYSNTGLNNTYDVESYYVNWCEGDIDENSYQHTKITVSGDLLITIKEENKT